MDNHDKASSSASHTKNQSANPSEAMNWSMSSDSSSSGGEPVLTSKRYEIETSDSFDDIVADLLKLSDEEHLDEEVNRSKALAAFQLSSDGGDGGEVGDHDDGSSSSSSFAFQLSSDGGDSGEVGDHDDDSSSSSSVAFELSSEGDDSKLKMKDEAVMIREESEEEEIDALLIFNTSNNAVASDGKPDDEEVLLSKARLVEADHSIEGGSANPQLVIDEIHKLDAGDQHAIFEEGRLAYDQFMSDGGGKALALREVSVLTREHLDEQIAAFKNGYLDEAGASMSEVEFTAEDIQQLQDVGYSDNEVKEMSALGLSPLLIRKLENKSLDLTIEESVACIQNGIKFGQKVAQSVTGKHLVLMIGTTGVGKSTTLNYFHGCTMRKLFDSDTHRKVIDVDPDSPIAKVTEIGHVNSKTFIPSIVEDAHSDLLYCDLPGSLDDRGAEINIANTANIKNIILSAESVKMLFLMDFPSIESVRGRILSYLELVLKNFFNIVDLSEIDVFSNHLLLGITKAPITDGDGDPITKENILNRVFNKRSGNALPDVLREQTLLIDPLNRRDNEGCSRDDWLNAINTVMPLSFDESVNLAISDSDVLALTEISRNISAEISEALLAEDFARVSDSLGNIVYLRVIGDEQVHKLIAENISDLLKSFNDMMRTLTLKAAEGDFDEAERIAKKGEEFVCRFHEHDETMVDAYIATLQTLYEKRLSQSEQRMIQSVAQFKSVVYQSADDDSLIRMHYLLSRMGLKQAAGTDVLRVVEAMANRSPELMPAAEAVIADSREVLSLAAAYDQSSVDDRLSAVTKMIVEISQHAESKSDEYVNEKIDAVLSEFYQDYYSLYGSMVWSDALEEIVELTRGCKREDLYQLMKSLQLLKKIAKYEELIERMISKYMVLESYFSLVSDSKKVSARGELIIRMLDLLGKMNELYQEEMERRIDEAARETASKLLSGLLIWIKTCKVKHVNETLQAITSAVPRVAMHIKNDTTLYPEIKIFLSNSINKVLQALTYEKVGDERLEKIQLVVRKPCDIDSDEMYLLLKSLRKIEINDAFERATKIVMVLIKISSLLDEGIESYDAAELGSELHDWLTSCSVRLLEEKRRSIIDKLIEAVNTALEDKDPFRKIADLIHMIYSQDKDAMKSISLALYAKEKVKALSRSLELNSYDICHENYEWLSSMYAAISREVLLQVGIEERIESYNDMIMGHVASRVQGSQVVFREIFSIDSIRKKTIESDGFKDLEETMFVLSKFKSIPGVAQILEEFSGLVTDRESDLVGYFSGLRVYKNQQVGEFVSFLILNEKLLNVIGAVNAELFTKIRKMVGSTVNHRGSRFLSWVCDELMSFVSGGCSDEVLSVINTYPRFKQARIQYFNELTNAKSSGDVFYQLEIDEKEKELLRVAYGYFNDSYSAVQQSIITNFQAGSEDNRQELSAFLSELIEKSKSIASRLSPAKGFSSRAEKFSIMLSSIFGVWAIQNALRMNYLSDTSVLLQPHSSQVMAILLLFGLHRKKNMENHALEIKTGEGKSLVNAISATVFALMDYEVHVICYNPYLVSRDEKEFRELFDAFGVRNKVKYLVPGGSFSELNSRLYQSINAFIDGNAFPGRLDKSASGNKVVGIMDELDVFFSRSFLGRDRARVNTFYKESVGELYKVIYRERDTLRHLSFAGFFKRLSELGLIEAIGKELVHFQGISKAYIKFAYRGFLRFLQEPGGCSVVDGKILYYDAVANMHRKSYFNPDYPYIALQAKSNGAMTEEQCKKYLKIGFTSSSLSYAELPKKFSYLFGVTGTLFGLNDKKSELLDKYAINLRTAIPSVFEKHKIDRVDQVEVFGAELDADDGYFNAIKTAIEGYIDSCRAVLVVFETDERIESYLTYLRTNPYRINNIKSNVLTASTDNNARDVVIQQAARYKQVTIMNGAYARGSDFVCYSSEVIAAGGVAVLGCYFPDTHEELVQMIGRTCRQDNPGSVELILSLSDLKKFGVTTKTEIEESDVSTYDYLTEKRESIEASELDKIHEGIERRTRSHQLTLSMGRLIEKYSVLQSGAGSSSSLTPDRLVDSIHEQINALNGC